MRIFFPGLLLLVSLAVFVVSGRFLVEYFHQWQNNYFPTSSSYISRGEYLAAAAVLLASTWAATWAWKEIRREKIGRID